MRRFLTLFPLTENVHLLKDVGMVPYILHKNFGYSSTVACYKIGEYEYLESELKGLQIVHIKKVFNNLLLDSILFLILNSRKYDILQTYHLQKSNAFILFIFKLITFGRGLTYMKLDMAANILKLKLNGVSGALYKFLIKNIDIMSIEIEYFYNTLNKTNFLGRQVIHIPNGFYDPQSELDPKLKFVDCKSKKKKILTVGRIGNDLKYNQVLLEAFALCAQTIPEWTLELAGPIEDHFHGYIDEYFKRNPQLKNRVNFTGQVTDRFALAALYSEASVFALTSKSEGFALVFVEAISKGCYILSSDLPSAQDVTNNGKYGDVFPIGDVDALSKLIISIANNPEKLAQSCNEIQEYAYQNFSWPNIIARLHAEISRVTHD